MKSPDEDVRKAEKPKKNSLPMLCDARGTLTPRARPKICKTNFKTCMTLKRIEKQNESDIIEMCADGKK